MKSSFLFSCLLGALAAGSLLFSSQAQAQIAFGDSTVEPIKNNVSFNTALRASDSNAAVFGAAAIAERLIFPALAKDGDYIIRAGSNSIYGAVHVPVTCLAFEENCGGQVYGRSPVDFSSAAVAAGYRFGSVGLFYAASSTGTVLAPSAAGRLFNGTVGGLYSAIGSYAGPVAPNFLKRDSDYNKIDINGFNYSTDYIAGAQLDLDYLQLRAGYVGSKGFFSNFSQSDLRLFLTTVLQTEVKSIPYLRTGFEKFPTDFLGEDSMTSLFVRKVRMVTPFEPDPERTLSDLKEAASFNQWTGHFQQLSIAKNFDLLGALAFSPTFTGHELRAGYHSEGFHQVAPDKDHLDDRKPEEGWGITAGIVRLPNMYYYGMQGGTKLSISVEGKSRVGRFSIRRNDPDLLAMFPFAYDAWNLYWEVGIDSVGMQRDD